MKNVELRRAGAQDADLLVDLRETVLIAADKLSADADLSHLDAMRDLHDKGKEGGRG